MGIGWGKRVDADGRVGGLGATELRGFVPSMDEANTPFLKSDGRQKTGEPVQGGAKMSGRSLLY